VKATIPSCPDKSLHSLLGYLVYWLSIKCSLREGLLWDQSHLIPLVCDWEVKHIAIICECFHIYYSMRLKIWKSKNKSKTILGRCNWMLQLAQNLMFDRRATVFQIKTLGQLSTSKRVSNNNNNNKLTTAQVKFMWEIIQILPE
jgi:hypothetical protein